MFGASMVLPTIAWKRRSSRRGNAPDPARCPGVNESGA
jgi:hypothetical protein